MVGKRKETRRAKCSGDSNKKRGRSRGEYKLRRASSVASVSTWSQYFLCRRGMRAVIYDIQRTISIIE